MTDRQTAAQRQAEGIADILRERDALREQVEYLVRAGHKQLERADAAEDALKALVEAWDAHALNQTDDLETTWQRFHQAIAAARALKAVGE